LRVFFPSSSESGCGAHVIFGPIDQTCKGLFLLAFHFVRKLRNYWIFPSSFSPCFPTSFLKHFLPIRDFTHYATEPRNPISWRVQGRTPHRDSVLLLACFRSLRAAQPC